MRVRQVSSTRPLALCLLEGAVMILDLLSLIHQRHLPPTIFFVKVDMESTGEVADIRAKLGEGVDDLV